MTPEEEKELLEKTQVDHERLARVESMLSFLLGKEIIEVERKPFLNETVLSPNATIKFKRSLYEEWSIKWKELLKKLEEQEEERRLGDIQDLLNSQAIIEAQNFASGKEDGNEKDNQRSGGDRKISNGFNAGTAENN